jgi:hypothetical protein
MFYYFQLGYFFLFGYLINYKTILILHASNASIQSEFWDFKKIITIDIVVSDLTK